MRRMPAGFGIPLIAILLGTATPAAAQRIKLPVDFDELEAAAARDSNDAVAHYNLALGHWSREEYDEAEASLREAIDLDVRLAPAYLALAYLPFARNPDLWDDLSDIPLKWDKRMREADRLYERAFMIDPVVDLRIAGAVVPKRSVLWQHSAILADFYDRWLQAFDDFRDGHYEDAYFRFDRFIEDSGGRHYLERVPGSFIWFQALSAAHMERWDDAVELTTYLLEAALAEQDDDELTYLPVQENGYRYLLAYLYQQSGDLERARDLYETALEKNFGLYMAHVRLAEIHRAQGDVEGALRERRLAVEASPDDPTLLLDLGVAQAKAGRVADAMQSLSAMTALQPRDARPYYLLGLLLQATGARIRARTAFETFLTLAPDRYGSQREEARYRLDAL